MGHRFLLVADASRARLFRQSTDGRYELLESFDHGESRARARDLVADATGRKPIGPSVGSRYGARAVALGFGRPGVAPTTEPKEVEAQKFARELADALEVWLDAESRLVLAAPPHFLGLLRATLSGPIAKRVELTLDKDLTQLDPRELRERVRGALSPS